MKSWEPLNSIKKNDTIGEKLERGRTAYDAIDYSQRDI